MAQKLHDTYGFSYDNLQVLLGGWNTWNQKSAADPKGYPVEVTAGATPGQSGSNPVVVAPGVVQITPGAPAPAGAPVVVTPKP